jgi:hypothetical protein
MNFFVWSTIILGIWAAVGPLVGVRYGHDLTKRWQKEQWVRDNELKEWQELLTTVVTSFQTLVRTDKALPSVPGEEIAQLKENSQARTLANEVLVNRIFIAREVRRDGLFQRWKDALGQFDRDHDPETFGTAFGELNALILRGARAQIGKV